MRSLKARLLDRLLLCVAALAAASGAFAFFELSNVAGLAEPWGMFVAQTLVWTVILFVYGIRLIRSRQRKLHRRWPLVTAGVLSFSLHCTVLGWIIYHFHPNWTMSHWIFIDVLELVTIGLLVEVAYEYSIVPTVPSIHEFREHLKRVLVSHR